MKRIVSLILLLGYLISLAACSKVPDEPDTEMPEESPHVCEYTVESTKAAYIKTRASCTQRAEYYYSCSCGAKGTESFEYGELAGHDFFLKSATQKYLVKEATVKTSAVYYKSCRCGATGTSTFEHGDPIKLSAEEQKYLPTSLTVTLYDSLGAVYGFTSNTVESPREGVIEIKKSGDDVWSEYIPASYAATTTDDTGAELTYYISKAEIALLPDTSYVYRVTDKALGISTPESKLDTKNAYTESFTFAHVSDSQAGTAEFRNVMAAVSDKVDFVIHTGDVVQYAHKEYEWTEMLDKNYEYVAGMPIMPMTGNHETSYNNATYEIEKHFNNQIPTQSSTALGYYYSFVYGNVKFIMLNTNDLADNRLKDEQYNWLISELESNTCKWTVVAMHNPMYSVGKYGADETRNAIALALRDQLQGVFAQYGVDLVLQAHDHAISRTFALDADGVATDENIVTEGGVEYTVDPCGVVYLMNGPAGTQTRSPVAVDETLYAHAETGRKASWAEITVTGDTLTVTVKWYNGFSEQVYYSWGIKKSS